MIPQGGFLTDLTKLHLLGWAALVQDMAAGLQVLPPRLSHDLGLQVVALLQLLEVATEVGFCHHCCNLRPCCRCVGVPQSTPPMMWSQFMEQTPVYGVTPSSYGVTAPSTSWGGMSGYMPPPPGLSIWNMPPLGDTSPLEPAAILPYQPPIGGTGQLGTPPSRPALEPQAPQMAPPICQPPPFPRGQLATLYQQAVQLPGKSLGLGVTFDSSATKPAPKGGQDADAHGRQGTRGRDDNSQPTGRSKGVWERSSVRMTSKQMPHQEGGHPSGAPHNVPPASTPGSTPHQCGGGMRAPKDPLENVTNYRSQEWRKDLECVFRAHYKYNFTSFKEAEWNKLRDKVLEHLLQCLDEWRSIKENDPLQYMPYMERQFHATTGIQLKGLGDFTGWIKQGSYYHGVVARKGQLHKCPHLVGVKLPRWPQITPSESH